MIEQSSIPFDGKEARPPASQPTEHTPQSTGQIHYAAIDLAHEELIAFRDVPGVLPRIRRGRKPHVASIYRWSDRGLKGVKLEYLQIGGTRCTSVPALQRFFERISFPGRERSSRTWSARQREIKRASDTVQNLLHGVGRRSA